MVECIAKVSHSSFSIVCCFPPHPHPIRNCLYPISHAFRIKCRRGKKTLCRKIIEMNEKRYFVTFVLLSCTQFAHSIPLYGPVFRSIIYDHLFSLMLRFFYLSRPFYMTRHLQFSPFHSSYFCLYRVPVLPHLLRTIGIYFIRCVYDRRLFMRLKSCAFCH